MEIPQIKKSIGLERRIRTMGKMLDNPAVFKVCFYKGKIEIVGMNTYSSDEEEEDYPPVEFQIPGNGSLGKRTNYIG